MIALYNTFTQCDNVTSWFHKKSQFLIQKVLNHTFFADEDDEQFDEKSEEESENDENEIENDEDIFNDPDFQNMSDSDLDDKLPLFDKTDSEDESDLDENDENEDKGKFFLKVKLCLVILTTFEFPAKTKSRFTRKSCILQIDPNQNWLNQKARTLKKCIFCPMLVKPKCIWKA